MSETCPGRCNARYRRAEAEHQRADAEWLAEQEEYADRLAEWDLTARPGDETAGPRPVAEHGDRPEPLVIRPRYGEPLWCSSCAATIRACLAELDELVPLRLEQSDGYQTPGDLSSERVSRSQEDPSPSPGHDDMDELIEWLRAWENEYRKVQRPAWPAAPYRGVSAPALTAATAWLGAHLDAMLAHNRIGGPFGIGVLWWHRRLQATTSTRPPLRKKPVPCRRCGRYSLFFHDDARRPTVRCHADPDRCGLIMTVPEYDEYQNEYEQQQKQAAEQPDNGDPDGDQAQDEQPDEQREAEAP